MTPNLELAPSRLAKGRAAVVASPHPLYGGRLDNPVVVAVAGALSDSGYAPLRFNWRGVGCSQGEPSGNVERAVEDYCTAVRAALEARVPGIHYLAAGYSFGAAAALIVAARDERVDRLLLVAPPVHLLDGVDVASIEARIHVIVGENDSFAPPPQLSKLLARAHDAQLDVVADADHFFAFPFWIDKLAELVRAELA